MACAVVPCSFFNFNSRSVVPKHTAWLLSYQWGVRQTNSGKLRFIAFFLFFFVIKLQGTLVLVGVLFVCLFIFFP